MSNEPLAKGSAQMTAWCTFSRPHWSQNETASGAKSTPRFFAGLPSRFKIEPVPQPTSKISFWRQLGTSLSSVSKISRCSARYHQCVSSTRNMISYSAGRMTCLFAAEKEQRLRKLIRNGSPLLDQKFTAQHVDIVLFVPKPMPF